MSKKLCFLLTIFLLVFLIYGCQKNYLTEAFCVVYTDDGPALLNPQGETLALSEYDEIIPEFGETLIVGKRIKQTMKYGYIKNTGEVLLKPQYDQAGLMKEHKAIVTKDGKQFIINPKGEILYTFPNHLKAHHYFQEGFLTVEILSTGKWTFMKEDFTLWNKSFDYASPFKNGYAIVGNINEGVMEYQLIDIFGLYVGNQKYHFADYFYDGWARVAYGEVASGRLDESSLLYFFIDQSGNTLKDETNKTLMFDYARNFNEGFALIGNYAAYPEGEFLYKEYNILTTDGTFPYQKTWKSFILGTGGYFLSVGDLFDGSVVLNGHRFVNANYVGKLFFDDDNKPFFYELELTKQDGTVIADNPINIFNFKITPYYQNKALAKVHLANQLYGLVDTNGTYILEPLYREIFY